MHKHKNFAVITLYFVMVLRLTQNYNQKEYFTTMMWVLTRDKFAILVGNQCRQYKNNFPLSLFLLTLFISRFFLKTQDIIVNYYYFICQSSHSKITTNTTGIIILKYTFYLQNVTNTVCDVYKEYQGQ